MKRGTPLKRRAMNRARPKPTPVYDAYKATCEMDEILFYTGVRLVANRAAIIEWPGVREPCGGVHHIWSIGSRPDVLSNLVGVSFDGHDEVHFGTRHEPVFVRLLGMLAKAIKAEKTFNTEFVVEDLDRCAGKSVHGWTYYAAVPRWCERYKRDLLCRLDAAASVHDLSQ